MAQRFYLHYFISVFTPVKIFCIEKEDIDHNKTSEQQKSACRDLNYTANEINSEIKSSVDDKKLPDEIFSISTTEKHQFLSPLSQGKLGKY